MLDILTKNVLLQNIVAIVTELHNPTLSEGLSVNLSVIDQMWLNFKSAFISVVDRHAPVINKRLRGIDCPWLNGEIKKVMYERDKESKIARKTNLAADWEKYKTLRNRVTTLVKSAKGSYNRKLIEDNSGDPKSFWRTLTRLIPGKKVLPRNIKVDNTSLYCHSTIANVFNKFFVGTISRLTEAMGPVFTSGASFGMYWRCNTPKELFHFEEISENFTLGQLNKLKSKKAVRLDAIPTRLIKDSAEVIANPLTKIINFSLANGCVPSEWKEARVIPLFKSGRSDNMDNYRPVSILPVVSKILERAVHTQLYKFMVDNNLLSPYQSGFRKRHSTETPCISFTDSIRRGMDQGMLTGSVFIDLRKAFDTVSHDLLLAKLHGYGVTGGELDWFKDYLSNRKQLVDYFNTYYDPLPLNSGVPQGSILGPLLFVIFVNDLPNAVNSCSILMYADDTVIFYSGKTLTDIENVVSADLNALNSWLNMNKLFLHVDKSECVLFGSAKPLHTVENFEISINGQRIKQVFK